MSTFSSELSAVISLEEIKDTILSFSSLPFYLQDPFENLFAEYIAENPNDAEFIWDYIVEANESGASLDFFDGTIAALVNSPGVTLFTKNEIISLLNSTEADRKSVV